MTRKQMKDYMIQNFGYENKGTIEFLQFCEEKHNYNVVVLWFERCKIVARDGE